MGATFSQEPYFCHTESIPDPYLGESLKRLIRNGKQEKRPRTSQDTWQTLPVHERALRDRVPEKWPNGHAPRENGRGARPGPAPAGPERRRLRHPAGGAASRHGRPSRPRASRCRQPRRSRCAVRTSGPERAWCASRIWFISTAQRATLALSASLPGRSGAMEVSIVERMRSALCEPQLGPPLREAAGRAPGLASRGQVARGRASSTRMTCTNPGPWAPRT